jgi:hypothetical protein
MSKPIIKIISGTTAAERAKVDCVCKETTRSDCKMSETVSGWVREFSSRAKRKRRVCLQRFSRKRLSK